MLTLRFAGALAVAGRGSAAVAVGDADGVFRCALPASFFVDAVFVDLEQS
jgi:hypothetical protein